MFYLINKPTGMSSFKCINEYAKENGIKKIGHTGTLDPLATGLLLVATDDDTKLISYVDSGNKEYRATMKLGATSTTYDSEGELTPSDQPIPSEEEIMAELKKASGTKMQLPPAFSAKKVNGKRAYELARENKAVELKPVKVVIEELRDIEINGDEVAFTVTVSRGTYIRSIIHDIGYELKCGAYMTALDRTMVANLTKEDLGEVHYTKIIKHEVIIANTTLSQRLLKGFKTDIIKADGQYLVSNTDEIIGIVEIESNVMHVKKMFGNRINNGRH